MAHLETNYTYNRFNQMLTVTMVRAGTTQNAHGAGDGDHYV